MTKEYLKKSWRKLDNTAKIFSLDDKDNTNIFRYSVILKQDIDEKILIKALERALNNYLIFKVKIGTGVFWNYLEYNPKEPIIKKEDEIPCQHINFKENNDYLFKVTYYKKKINLDIFHVLTDGTGAISFLKSIIYNYLSLKYNLSFSENTNNSISYQDQYLRKYDKNLKVNDKFKMAYQIPGKVNKHINNTYHYIIDIDKIKKVCKNYGVTITEYLTAIYIYAMYLSIYNKNSRKEINIAVPINLRKYYQVDTLSNFFVCMNVNAKVVGSDPLKFDEVLKNVHKDFQEKLEIDKVKSYLTRDVNLGMNVIIRLVPLFMKKIVMKFIGNLVTRTSTSTLSNVGVIDIDDKYEKYIDNILVLVMPSKVQKIKCTVCSFGKYLNVTVNSNIEDSKFEQRFYKLLKSQLDNVKLVGNNGNSIKGIREVV